MYNLITGTTFIILAWTGSAAAQRPPDPPTFDEAIHQLRPASAYSDGNGDCTVHLALGRHNDVELSFEGAGGRIWGINPFDSKDFPSCIVISIFDASGQFLGSFPELEPLEARTQSFKAALLAKSVLENHAFQSGETQGIRIALSTDPVSAQYQKTLVLNRPGKYILQAVCSRVLFADGFKDRHGPPPSDEEILRFNRQLIHPRFFNSEACRSAPLEIFVEDEDTVFGNTPSTVSGSQTEPVISRLEFVRYTDAGSLEVRVRMDNASLQPIWLYEPVLSHFGRTHMPARVLLMDDGRMTFHDWAKLEWGKNNGPSRSTFVKLPPNGFVSRVLTIDKRWAQKTHAVQVVYDEELFPTDEYVDFFSQRPSRRQEEYDRVLEQNRLSRPKYKIESNLLRVMPPDQPQ